jgi:hypothetical protein
MADVAARAVLSMQADAAPGTLAAALASEANLHLEVHQAAGMVSVQLGVTIAEALVRLCGHTFRADRLLGDVADDVVNRRLRFSESPDG